ncbi:MAG: SpoIIIAH-like family protein [Acetivibrionales bacterium]|jgi:stage III sporulation protein AH
MKGFRRKQIVVLSLVLMIVVAGYLQYSYKKSSITAENKEKGKLGEAVYVDNQEVDIDDLINQAAASDEITEVSEQANEFFAQAKLDKEISLSRDTDMLKQITEDANADDEIKADAFEKMMVLVDKSQKEMRIEALIKEKGFEDVIALFGNDGSIDIIVKAPSLSSSDTAQIADIASRHAGIDISQIYVKSVY